MPSVRTLVAGASLLSAVTAQTSTSCNPTEETCPSDTGLDQSTYTVDFTQGASDDWNVTYGSVTYDSTNGATYTITESGDAPTMQTNWYIFFGEVTVEMMTAPGTGIVSCAILESDDLDEIDWEWLGGTADQVESNYFGKGNTTTYDREQYFDLSSSTQAAFHNYTVTWTKSSLSWSVDGTVMRTLDYADADDGANYPQTPMRVKLGIWAGGDSSNSEGTIEWAGGETDYSDGPFTAYVKRVSITNYNPAESYTYSDESGSYDSITLSGASSSSSDDDGSTTTTSSTQTEGTSTSTAAGADAGAATGVSSSSSSSSGSAAAGGSGAIVSTNSTANPGSSNSTASNSTTTSSSSSTTSTLSASGSTVATAGAPVWGPSLTVVLGMLGFAAMMV